MWRLSSVSNQALSCLVLCHDRRKITNYPAFWSSGWTASNALTEAENLVKLHENARALLIDMEDKERIARLVQQADVVVR